MSFLSQLSCTRLRPEESPASDDEVAQLHAFIPSWEIKAEGGGRKLRHTFAFDEEETARRFVGLLGEVVRKEDADHSPELEIQGARVNVAWWTTPIHDLHPNDFIMAGKTDGAYTLAVVGAKGDMFTDEPLPTLADLPRFGKTFAGRKQIRRTDAS